ncbi:hypothetical protein IV203_030691 [Nitzschia inconspicua]|uniref:Protein kinase domain-containing protein n=1 Tax=Nitzschia inconspicua TaxID=303405 RepID=A0A9K3Q1V8_9STRA|nr:hypothetical protein IV203_030691 [Nitzschia inconspicua]
MEAVKDAVGEMERVVKKDLTESEASCLLSVFSSEAVLISLGQYKDRDIQSLFLKIQRMVKTATKAKLFSSYTFDGLVPMAFGRGNNVLQYVLRGSDLYCAKIGDAATIEAEVQASRLIHENQLCPSVMPVIDSIRIDENRAAMITPFYPMPVSHATVTEPTIVNVALCGIATIKAFSNKNMCHGDIKPSNMMFQASSRTVISIDFGSCKEYGNMLTETSPLFGLDCGNQASLRYDLTCLAASIMLLSGIKLDMIATREDALSELASRSGVHITLANLCLDESVSNLDDMWEQIQTLVRVALPNADFVVDLNEIWPKRI